MEAVQVIDTTQEQDDYDLNLEVCKTNTPRGHQSVSKPMTSEL